MLLDHACVCQQTCTLRTSYQFLHIFLQENNWCCGSRSSWISDGLWSGCLFVCFLPVRVCLSNIQARVWHRQEKKMFSTSGYNDKKEEEVSKTKKKKETKCWLVENVMKETWSLASQVGEPLMCFTYAAKSTGAEHWTLNFNSLHPQGTSRYSQTSTQTESDFNCKQAGKSKCSWGVHL